MERPKILCVDDEPQVLEGLQAVLRRRYDVATATGGAAALDALAAGLAPVAIVSDMRMPQMDGATFLSRAKALVPDASRLLLTGHADMASAIAAVNEGQIFRFLSKPCPAPTLIAALDAAVEQHRLVTAERVLLEQTLHGSIKTLADVLALTNPVAFGRATRIRARVADLLQALGVRERWQVEVAAMLSQLGAITLPPEVAEKLYFGYGLTADEQKMVARLPAITEQLLGHIPRLEEVRAILTTYPSAGWTGAAAVDPAQARVERAAAILRVAVDFDALEAQGTRIDVALETLRGRGGYAPEVLDALTSLFGRRSEVVIREVAVGGLRVGMLLAEDLKRTDGMLVLARGGEITSGVVERVKNFRAGTIREPIRVVVPDVAPATTASVGR